MGCIFVLVFSCSNSAYDDRRANAEIVSILINGTEPESVVPLKYGNTYTLTLSNNSSAAWTTSDQSVAALSSSSGDSVTLTARSAGYAVIKATANGTTYSCPLLIADKKDDSDYNEQYNVVFTNFSAYKVIVCRDGLNNEIATLEAGAKKSLYVAPGSNEIIFYFRYSYCVIEDSDSGMVWLDVADSTAYTYPVDSSDVASGTVWITIPAPKNPQFNAAFLKVYNKSASPISLYKGNAQQKLYNSEKIYIQPEHSGVYSIPASAQGASFDGWTLGDSPASAIPIAPFNAEYGVIYHCDFSSGFFFLPITEELRLAELQAEETFTVTFESNGGTPCSPMETLVLEKLQMPVPERQDYDFAGWFTDSGLENPLAYPYTVTADITLYAKWVESSDIVITAQTANSIDLNDITGEYTIKVTGNISQNTLQTLANKMKASKNALFTLDLSDATGLTVIVATSDNTSIFADCPLRSVVLPKTLDAISSYAFYGCSDLESVEIDGTETVGAYAFANCTNLQHISLKNTNTIGKYSFQNCTSLVSITIDTTTIGVGMFSGCTTLTSVVIGKNVKSLDNSDDGCFYKCNQLTSVRFEDTAKWYYKYSSSYSYSLNVTNAATNASNLKSYRYLWYKE